MKTSRCQAQFGVASYAHTKKWHIFLADEKMNSRQCVRNDSAVLFRFMLRERYRRHVVASALTFRDFVPRLELLTHYRDFLGISGILGDFHKSVKMYERNYFSLFCKSYLILFLSFIIGTPILCWTTSDLWIFRDFLVLFQGFLELHLWEPWLWLCMIGERALLKGKF